MGYKNFDFTGFSHSNGASFYFDGENGEKLRVSDHRLTGRRAFEVTQIDIVEVKRLPSPFKLRSSYVKGEITMGEYKAICEENGFLYRP